MDKIAKEISSYSGNLNTDSNSIAIILAAGKGKRIKSEIPKVLHPIWGIPSIIRVCDAVIKGLNTGNQVVVVGKKAHAVVKLLNESINKNRIFVYQKIQRGTGHAVQVALTAIKKTNFKGNVFIFPGDTGLIDSETIRRFKREFERKNCSMMLLTGKYTDTPESNPYGRIVRVPSKEGNSGEVIEILQARDILNLAPKKEYKITYNMREYSFSRQQLLEIAEFDSGIIAFKLDQLIKHIGKLKPENIQKELYITDLVKIFREAGLKIETYLNDNSDVLLGFNSRADLKKMESIIRRRIYELLKDIVTFADEENFFIDSEVVKQILQLDKEGLPVDITIGEGASIVRGVKLNRGVVISKGAILDGNIILGKKVRIGENVHISTYTNQKLYIGDNTEIYPGNIIKGNVRIGKNVRIETGVRITGNNETPTYIGNNCIIKGTTYIFGSFIENNCWIQHSIIMNKHLKCIRKRGKIQKIRFILPEAEGLEAVQQAKFGSL